MLPVLEDKWRGRNMLQMYCSMQLEVFRSVIGRFEISRLCATRSIIIFFFFFEIKTQLNSPGDKGNF